MKHAQGSTILVFIIVMAGLVSLTSVVWRTISYSVDTTLTRQVHYQALYCARGMQQWAIKFVTANYDLLATRLGQGEHVEWDMSSWPVYITTLRDCKRTVSIKRMPGDEFNVRVSLANEYANCTMACNVARDHISSWEMGE